MVDAVAFSRVRVAACSRCIKQADREEQVGIFEPLQAVAHERFRHPVAHRAHVVCEPIKRIQRSVAINEPMGQFIDSCFETPDTTKLLKRFADAVFG